MYDCDITGGGHQPSFFDKLGSTYDHYTVVSSRIVIQMIGHASSFAPTAVLYIDDDTTVASSSIGQAIEQHGAKFQATRAAAASPVTLYNKWSAGRTFGPGTTSDPEMQGTYNTNPAEMSYYVFCVTDVVATAQVTLTVKIEYDVIWDELRTEPLN
jgi:hypothetical protein